MKRLVLAPILIAVSLLSVTSPALGVELDEVILNVTLSANVSAGVEGSWGLDSYSHIRTGVNLVVDLCRPTPAFGLWARALYLYTFMPHNRLSFYGGLGLSGMLGFIEKWPPPPIREWSMPLLIGEAPGGIKYSLNDRFSLLAELRFGFLWPGGKLVVAPLALTAGVGYSIQ